MLCGASAEEGASRCDLGANNFGHQSYIIPVSVDMMELNRNSTISLLWLCTRTWLFTELPSDLK